MKRFAWLLACALVVLFVAEKAAAQPWTGPFNPTGDTLIVDPVAIADTEDNIHLIFKLHVGDLIIEYFHMKYSPYGEVLIPPHQLTTTHIWGADVCGIFLHEPPFIDLAFYQVGTGIKALRFDYNGILVEPPYTLLRTPSTVEAVFGWTAALDAELRYHILYSTHEYYWPTVFYARTSRRGDLQIGPDTVVSMQPYYHARMSSVVNSANQFLAVWSNVDGWDQYLQAAVVDSDGTLLAPPFNPIPDTTHLPGASGRLRINHRDQVVMQYGTNPPGPDDARIELYSFDCLFNVVDCTRVFTDIQGEASAWGDIDFDGNNYDRMLNVYETAVLTEDDHWERRTYTKAYDFDLNPLGGQDSLDVSSIDSQGNLSVLCAPGFEAVWMDASPVGDPYVRLFSWHRIVNADCLAVGEPRPIQPLRLTTPLVWPNPTNGVVHLTFPNPVVGPVEFAIFNILGQRICSQKLQLHSNVSTVLLPDFFSRLSSGCYFISYKAAENGGIVRVTLQK